MEPTPRPSTSPKTPPTTLCPSQPWVGNQWTQWARQAHTVSLGESGLLRRRAPWSWSEARLIARQSFLRRERRADALTGGFAVAVLGGFS